jgi:hypothetical protein
MVEWIHFLYNKGFVLHIHDDEIKLLMNFLRQISDMRLFNFAQEDFYYKKFHLRKRWEIDFTDNYFAYNHIGNEFETKDTYIHM